MTEEPYPEIGITEETRRMYPDYYSEKYAETFKSFIDEVLLNKPPKPKRLDHSILLDELAIMYEASMEAGGEQARFNASVLKAAINVVRAL